MKTFVSIYYILNITILFCNVEEYMQNIQLLINSKSYLTADSLFKQGVSEYDASGQLYFIGGQISLKLDRLDVANSNYIKAISLEPNNKEYREEQLRIEELKNKMNNAKKSFDNGRIEDSIIEYSQLTEQYSDHAIVFYNLGRVYKIQEEHDLAVENYQIAKILNPFEIKYSQATKAIAQEMAKAGDTEYRRQEFDSAIDNYKKAIEYSPDYTTALFKLARTYFKLRDHDNAINSLEQNLNIDDQQEQSEKMMGDVYRNLGSIDKAIIHYNRAISLNNNYYKAYYSLGSALMSDDELAGAKNAMNTAILIEPTYGKAYGSLGIIEQELGNYNEAIHNYIIAIEYDPKAYDIFYRLSSAYNQINNYEKARKTAKNCLNIKRNYAPAYFELGISEKLLGNKIAAIDAFEKAKKDKNWRKSAQFELDLLNKGF